MKICNKCKLEQDEKEYLPNRSCKDGLSKTCTSCRAEAKGMTKDDFWWDYLIHTATDVSYYNQNPEVHKNRTRKWAEENPDKVKVISKRRYENNKEYYFNQAKKRRELSVELDYQWTPEMEQALRELFPCCVVCGKTEEQNFLEEGRRLHVDHVRPLSKGFGLYPGNAIILCGKCNRSKLDKGLEYLLDEIREKIGLSAKQFEEQWNDH